MRACGCADAGVLTFAAISEVGVGGRRVDGGHCLNSQLCLALDYVGRVARMCTRETQPRHAAHCSNTLSHVRACVIVKLSHHEL